MPKMSRIGVIMGWMFHVERWKLIAEPSRDEFSPKANGGEKEGGEPGSIETQQFNLPQTPSSLGRGCEVEAFIEVSNLIESEERRSFPSTPRRWVRKRGG